MKRWPWKLRPPRLLPACGRCASCNQEKQIISLRFGIPNGDDMTLEQVGKVLGITRERVRQIQNKALDKLRGHPSLKFLKDFQEE